METVPTGGAPGLLKVEVPEVQHPGHHPEEVQLLRVVQADALHGLAHPLKVPLIVQQRVLQGPSLSVLGEDRELGLGDRGLGVNHHTEHRVTPRMHSVSNHAEHTLHTQNAL